MAKDGALHRVLEGLRTLLASQKDIDTPPERAEVEKAAGVKRGTLIATSHAWEWIQKEAGSVLVEPLLAGERSLVDVEHCRFDVLKTADGHSVVLDCLVYKGHQIASSPLSYRRYCAARFVSSRHASSDARWSLSPAYVVATRVDLAKAWAWASMLPGSRGVVVKRSAPYRPGLSVNWIMVAKDPTAADVHVDGTNWGAKKKDYDDESDVIKTNQQTPAAKAAHQFEPAKHANQDGTTRCLKCGAPGSVEKMCMGYGVQKAAGVRIVKRDPLQRVMLGVVHQPDVEDLQGDIISAPEIEKAAYGFMAKLIQGEAALNLDHTQPLGPKDAQLVEHYIAPIDFQIPQADGTTETVLKGSWLQAWRLSPALWSKVEKGEYTGFSMGGYGKQTPVTKDADDAAIDRPTIRVDLEQPAPPPPPPQPNIEVHIHQPSQAGKFRMQKEGKTVAELERIPDGEE